MSAIQEKCGKHFNKQQREDFKGNTRLKNEKSSITGSKGKTQIEKGNGSKKLH